MARATPQSRTALTQQTLAFGPQSGTQTFGLGRMRSSAEGGVTVHFDYSIGRVTTRLDSGLRWGTTFDAGAPAASQYPSGTVVVHERGGAQRLQRLIADGTLLARVQDYAQLDAPGTVHIGDAEQIERRDVYDHRRRLIGRAYQVNGRSVADLRYAYDDADREVARQHLHRGGVTDFFSYDADSRLTGADLGARPGMGSTSSPWSLVAGGAGWSSGHFSRSYSYDSSGLDLLLQVTSHSVAGDPTPTPSVVAQRGSPNGMSFLADADGFMREVDALGNVTRIQTAGQDTELEYDALSRLRVVRRGNLTIQYQWRADGPLYRRTATCTPAGAGCTASDRLYLYDGMLLLEEQDAASGAVLARYYYAEEGDIPIGADLRLSSSAPLARYYFVVDRQGSVIMLLDEAGDPVEEVLYDPYGAPVVQPADDQLAEVYRVTLDGTDLVVAFTEPVVTTPVVPTSTTPEVVGFGGVASHFVVTQAGSPVAFQARFVDTEPGYQRGTVFRLTPTTAWNPALGYRLRIPAGSFRDLSNNGNQAFTLDFAGAAGVYWFGVAQGTTRPVPRVDSAVGNNLLFQSHLVDNDTGLYLARARVLDPRTGSFLQVDPSGYADSPNLYAGFANDPINNRDPTGRNTWDSFVGFSLGYFNGIAIVFAMVNSPGHDDEAQRANIESTKFTPAPGVWSKNALDDADFRRGVDIGQITGSWTLVLAGGARGSKPAVQAAAEDAAIAAQGPPKLGNMAGALRLKDGTTIRAVSSRGTTPPPHEPAVQSLVDSVASQGRGHGFCWELNALDKAIQLGKSLEGAESYSCMVRPVNNPNYLRGVPACETCSVVLKEMGVKDAYLSLPTNPFAAAKVAAGAGATQDADDGR